MFLSKERDEKDLSEALSKECSDVSMEEAQSKARTASLAAMPAQPAAEVASNDVESTTWCLPVANVGEAVNDEMDRLWVRCSTAC